MERLVEVTDGVFDSLFNDQPREPEHNLKYASQPASDLIEQYTRIVDDSQTEIDALITMFESKKLDKSKLHRENNKFLAQIGGKTSWQQYECMLANERVTGERLQELLLKKNKIDVLLDEGRKCTYEDHMKKASNFGLN